ncbi:MAG: hypothetical protein MUO88_09560, partial [Desulfobacterales bacterium]|nr:hypothetical protein [Desulfobacterales bacterium]
MAFRIIRLEERIVLDGAGAGAIAEAADAADQYNDAVEAAESEADDASSEAQHSDDTSDDLAADHLTGPVSETASDTVLSDSAAILVISDSIQDADQMVNAAGDNVLVIRYSPSNMTSEALLGNIKEVLGDQKVESIAFACAEIGEDSMELASDITLSNSTLAVSE